MSRQSLRNLRIKVVDEEAFGLYSVVANPRSVTPYDVKSACQNIAFEYDGKKPARDVVSLANFVLTGYFEFAHRTGLYNRQKEMWDALARVTSCHVDIVRQGMLVPVKIPVLDFVFYNSQNVPLILARLVKPQKRKDFAKRSNRYLSSFIQRVNKLQTKKGTLTGAMICYPTPVSEIVINKIQSKVGASDPANRFDSRLPLPAGIPIDILEMDYGNSSGNTLDEASGGESVVDQSNAPRLIYPEEELFPVTLVHPDLGSKR